MNIIIHQETDEIKFSQRFNNTEEMFHRTKRKKTGYWFRVTPLHSIWSDTTRQPIRGTVTLSIIIKQAKNDQAATWQTDRTDLMWGDQHKLQSSSCQVIYLSSVQVLQKKKSKSELSGSWSTCCGSDRWVLQADPGVVQMGWWGSSGG